MNPISMIHGMVRSGRITPAQGAWLLQLRHEILWRREPWWKKAAVVLVRMVFG